MAFPHTDVGEGIDAHIAIPQLISRQSLDRISPLPNFCQNLRSQPRQMVSIDGLFLTNVLIIPAAAQSGKGGALLIL